MMKKVVLYLWITCIWHSGQTAQFSVSLSQFKPYALSELLASAPLIEDPKLEHAIRIELAHPLEN